MTIINPTQYKPNDAWIIARLDSIIFVKDESADVYVLMDVATGHAFPPLAFLGDFPSEKEFTAFFKRARKDAKYWPKTLFLGKEDPAEAILKVIAEETGFTLTVLPISYLAPILLPLKESFDRFQAGKAKNEPAPKTIRFLIFAFAGILFTYGDSKYIPVAVRVESELAFEELWTSN